MEKNYKDWDGETYPLTAGFQCEYKSADRSGWRKCRIKYDDDEVIVLSVDDDHGVTTKAYPWQEVDFRKELSEEQKAIDFIYSYMRYHGHSMFNKVMAKSIVLGVQNGIFESIGLISIDEEDEEV